MQHLIYKTKGVKRSSIAPDPKPTPPVPSPPSARRPKK